MWPPCLVNGVPDVTWETPTRWRSFANAPKIQGSKRCCLAWPDTRKTQDGRVHCVRAKNSNEDDCKPGFFGCFVVSTVLVAICGASAPGNFCRGSPPSLKNARDNMRLSILLAMRAARRLHQPSDKISSLRPDVDPMECHSIVKVCVNPCKHFIGMYFDIFVALCTYICIYFTDSVQIQITHIYERD